MSKECIPSKFYIKRLSVAKPPFDILRFDIQHSAVRCFLNPEPLNPYNKKVFTRTRQMGGLKTFLSMISGDPKKEITFSHTDREIWRGLDLF